MSNTLKIDLSDSAKDFVNIVCPKLQELGFISGRIVPIEAVTTEELTKAFDLLAGIDLWLIEQDKGITGLASRVQWGVNYQSFTVRETRYTGTQTELEKRMIALTSNGQYIYPYWTCQAYLTERHGSLLSLGLAKTKDIFEAISNGYYHRLPAPDGNNFLVIYWRKIQGLGYKIRTWEPQIKLL